MAAERLEDFDLGSVLMSGFSVAMAAERLEDFDDRGPSSPSA